MLKIYAITDDSWYPKYSMDRFRQHATELSFVTSPEDANLIWHYSYYVPDPSLSETYFRPLNKLLGIKERKKRTLRSTPIVGSVHHLVPEKKPVWQANIKRLNTQADFIHYFSESNLRKDRENFSKPVIVAPYWIDLQMFRPINPELRRQIKTRLGLPTDCYILGSFQRDTEADGRSPKLEKGPDIFADVIERLGYNKIFVLLAGPRRDYLEQRLKRANIEYRSLGQVAYNSMPELYGAIDCYLVTSRMEGGPQAILECMATMTPIYSTPVGIANLLEPDAIMHTTNGFIRALKNVYPELLERHLEKIRHYGCERVVPYYENLFSKIISSFIDDQVDQRFALSEFPRYEKYTL